MIAELPAGAVLLAAKGDDANLLRQAVRERGAWANIPPISNRKDPVCFSRCLYKARNLVERFFNMIKRYRRIATRYGKVARTSSPLYSSPRYPCGCALMSLRPSDSANRTRTKSIRCELTANKQSMRIEKTKHCPGALV